MDGSLLIALVMRWAHILSAIVALGGIFFTYFLLTPVALRTLPDRQPEVLRAALMRRWRIVVHATLLLFLISGFYNYFYITRLLHQDQPIYHILWGIKVLLALIVFALAVGLSSGKSWSNRMREKASGWTALLIVLAVVVVMISGVLKNLPQSPGATSIAFSATDDAGISLSITSPGE